MNQTKTYLHLFLMVILFGCNKAGNYQNTSLTQAQKVPTEIDVEHFIGEQSEFKLSDLADSIRYISLNTPSGIVVSSIRKIDIYKNDIFIKSKAGIFQFDLRGSFKREFGKKGKGPNEYIFASDFDIDEIKEELIICCSPKLLIFNINDGSFKRKIDINTESILVCDSIICCTRETLGYEKQRMVAINGKADTLLTLPNYDLYHLNRGLLYNTSSKIAYPFYENKGKYYLRGEESDDTIWHITTQQITPQYLLKLGKYKLPREASASYDREKFKNVGNNYFGVPRMLEDNRYLFLTIKPWISEVLFTKSVIYDKINQSGYSISSSKIPGFKDDILGGPNFWPYNITDNYYAGTMEAFEILEYFENNNSSVHPKLQEQINQLKITSNSLVILCKRKN